MNIMIFGAQAMAYSLYKAFRLCHSEYVVQGFLVTSLEGNPRNLDGIEVKELASFAEELREEDRKAITIFAAVPQNQLSQVEKNGKMWGFGEWISVDSRQFAAYMEDYFRKKQEILLLKDLKAGRKQTPLTVYAVRSAKDQVLSHQTMPEEWIYEILAGSALTVFDNRTPALEDTAINNRPFFYDNTGENISERNQNYCELTALYWIWKQELSKRDGYIGLFHYRRYLEISKQGRYALEENGIDAILPYPMLFYPNISIHHRRYVTEEDWRAMRRALQEIHPEYEKALPEIFSQPYFYNYNILIARKKILEEYCSWLFPVLQRTEELSIPKGRERGDRYIGYLGENLLTLYFLFNKSKLKIVHTGLRMLT